MQLFKIFSLYIEVLSRGDILGSHRMFTNAVTDSDLFLDMSLSAQALYFHLGLHADDDGFVSSPKRIARSIGCNEDDLKLLIAKGFVICFDSGIIVITHWLLHNSIRKDRKKDTLFKTEKALLSLDNGTYSKLDNQMTTTCQPSVNQMSAQDKISKDKLSEDKTDSMSTAVDSRNAFDYQEVVDSFNTVCVSLPKVQKLNDKRRKQIVNADKLLGEMSFDELFSLVESSDFLTGRNGKWSGCGFDWILQPANLTKIIEGNYINKESLTVNTTAITQRNYDEEF